jgi:DNA replication protein DnaC
MSIKMVMPGVFEFIPDGQDADDFEKYQSRLKWSGIPAEYKRTCRLSTFEMVKGREEGFEAACKFLRGEIEPPMLMLYGEPGRSKTHLAAAIGLCFIAQLKSVCYYHVGDLLDELREGMRIERALPLGEHSSDTATSILNRCKGYQLLILDDLGVEKETDWACEKLDTIVNHRYENALPTVITSNTLDISDRIRDRCRQGLVVRLTGESYREIIAKRKVAEQHGDEKKVTRRNTPKGK